MKYEYTIMIAEEPLEIKVNALAQVGWRLKKIYKNFFIFEREKGSYN